MRFGSLIVAALLMNASAPLARAANTVAASFWIPAFGVPATSPPTVTCTTSLPCEVEALRAEGAVSLSTISVGEDRIVIVNLSPIPFCSGMLPCSDPFVGFEFVFPSGVDITGVSVDSASAADFLPKALQLLSPTRIVVDVTGDNPVSGHKLIVDLTGRRR
jgi:hypothetical protein